MSHLPASRCSRNRGFSLVEVAMAIGIMAFCVLAIVAMLPVGLSSIRRANEQVTAANAMRTLSSGFLQNVTVTNQAGAVFQSASTLTNVMWSPGGAAVTTTTNLSVGGFVVAGAGDAGLAVVVKVTPPGATSFAAGQARIRLASPAGAQWNGSRWTNSQSSFDGMVYFRAP